MAQYNTVILGIFQLDFGGKAVNFQLKVNSFTEPTCMRYNALSDLSWSIVYMYVTTSSVQFKGSMVMIAVKFKFS